MHLLVLSAFRQEVMRHLAHLTGVSMHLLVLSAFRQNYAESAIVRIGPSQCTFWCSVLSDRILRRILLYRLSLNAPFGAQCFPTLL